MKSSNVRTRSLVAASFLSLMSFGAANATTVSFSNFTDQNPGLFDTANTAAGAVAGTTLNIVLDNLAARSGSFGSVAAQAVSDTIGFTATAAPGYKIVSVRYGANMELEGTAASSFVFGGGSMSLQGFGTTGFPTQILAGPGIFSSSGTSFIDDAGLGGGATSLNIFISSTLVSVSDARIEMNGAGVLFDVAPVPLPPAAMLFGGALMTLAAWRTRPQGSKNAA